MKIKDLNFDYYQLYDVSPERTNEINENVPIETYNDHRMAMAFAPLALISNLKIKYPSVVSKSYPYFWNDLSKLGFKIFFQ